MVGCLREVRYEVAGRETQFLQVNRVAGAHLLQRFAAAEERDGLLRAAVHRVHHLQLLDPEIVVRLHFGEDFLDGTRARVAPRLAERHGRRLIVEHVNRVLRRGIHLLALGADELDAVEAGLRQFEVARERAVRLDRQRRRAAFLEQNLSAGRLHRRHDVEQHVGAAQRHHITAVLLFAWRQVRVGGEAVLDVELPDGGQIDDLQREMLRLDAIRIDVIDGVPVEAEHHPFEGVRVRRRDERQALELSARVAHHQRDVLRREAHQLRADRLIAAARDAGVPGQDFDLVRARRFRALRQLQQCREAAPDVCGAERDEERGDHGESRQGHRVPAQPGPIDRHAVLDRAALRNGLLNEPFNQLLRLAFFRC